MTRETGKAIDDVVSSISVHDLYRKWRRGEAVDIIDVRFSTDFSDAHVPGARSVPFDQLDPGQVMARRAGDPAAPLYIICQIGVRSLHAAKRFLAAGFANVVNVEGGTREWRDAGLPVVHEPRTGLALRRQVQLVAGSLVALGCVLAWLVDPAFVALPVTVGVGLVYTGATDRCVIGVALAKAPWNRAGSSPERGAESTLEVRRPSVA